MKTIRFIVVVVFAMSAVASAQWLKYPTAGIPRTADGKPDLTATDAAARERKAGARRAVAAGAGRTRRRKHREEPQGTGSFPAVGRSAVQGAPGEQQPRRSDRQMRRRRRAAIGPGRVSLSDPRGARHGGYPLRGRARVSPDFYRWARAAEGSESGMVRLLGREMGRRRLRRDNDRVQRQRLAGQRRTARDRRSFV